MTETLKDWDENRRVEWDLVQFGNRINQWMKWISEAEFKPMNEKQEKAVAELAKKNGVNLRMNEPFIESIKWTTGVGKNDRFIRRVGGGGYRRFSLNPDSFADWKRIESEEQARKLHQEIIGGGGVVRGLLIEYPKNGRLNRKFGLMPTFWLFSTSVSHFRNIINPYLIQYANIQKDRYDGRSSDLNPTILVGEDDEYTGVPYKGLGSMWDFMVGSQDDESAFSRFMFVYSPPHNDIIYGYNYSKGYGN